MLLCVIFCEYTVTRKRQAVFRARQPTGMTHNFDLLICFDLSGYLHASHSLHNNRKLAGLRQSLLYKITLMRIATQTYHDHCCVPGCEQVLLSEATSASNILLYKMPLKQLLLTVAVIPSSAFFWPSAAAALKHDAMQVMSKLPQR